MIKLLFKNLLFSYNFLFFNLIAVGSAEISTSSFFLKKIDFSKLKVRGTAIKESKVITK